MAFVLIKPSAYWQTTVVHIVLFAGFFASFFSFEFFIQQLTKIVVADKRSAPSITPLTLYILGYSALLFGGLSLVGVAHCSPDIIAFALTFWVAGLLLAIRLNPYQGRLYLGLGFACALFYLDRTAFAPSVLVVCAVLVVIARSKRIPLRRTVFLFLGSFLLLSIPFIVSISLKTHRFTIGESGRLNYGWEVDGADRLIHWQGKPPDLGKPIHPTTQISSVPKAFLFPKPITSTYPPWFDPSYWYDGIRPTFKINRQLPVLAVNTSIAANYVVRSPTLLPATLVIAISGLGLWRIQFLKLWPVVVPIFFGLLLYCFVYFEKRYIAGNLVVLWVLVPAAVRFRNEETRRMLELVLGMCAVVFVSSFVFVRQIDTAKTSVADLIQRREKYRSVDFALARRFQQLGLQPGDEIAFIGAGMNANWARLAKVRIVAEIPLTYGRSRRIFNNLLIDDTSQIQAFWNASEAVKQELYSRLRRVGVKMIVTDGYFCSTSSVAWSRALPESSPGIPKFDPHSYSQINTRYLRLD